MPLAVVIPIAPIAPIAPPRALDDRSSDELMVLARAGHREAFAAIVGRYGTRIAEFCVKMMGDRRTGEDVAQETWLAVWAARDRYRESQQLEAFLFTIARNRSRNALRSRRRLARVVVEIDGEADAPRDDASSLDAMLDRERRRRVHEATLALPPKLREVVLLRFVAGLDYPAISAAVSRNESTVRSRVFHGLRQLRELVQEGS